MYHVTAHPPIRYNDLFGGLARYGWAVQRIEYLEWRSRLEQHVLADPSSTNALFPLLHFVLDDLPWGARGVSGYQIIRGALAAQATGGRFLLLCDA